MVPGPSGNLADEWADNGIHCAIRLISRRNDGLKERADGAVSSKKSLIRVARLRLTDQVSPGKHQIILCAA
ncbi:MAG: hypothetical protein V3S33_04680 [Gammaproteobacteria bacterium]